MHLLRLINTIYVLSFLLLCLTPWHLAAQNAACENVKTIPTEGTQTETNTDQSEYWYSFQTPNDGQNRDLTVMAAGTTISIFNFPCVANDLIIASAPGLGSVTASALIPNTAYIIKIVNSNPGEPFNLTSFTVTTSVSSGGGGGGGTLNNTCADAIVITANGTEIVTNTGEAAYWYQFVMPSSPSTLQLSSDPGANIPVTVYSGTDCNNLMMQAQGTSASGLNVTTLSPNTVVWIKWGAQLGTTGSFVLNALPTGGGGGGSNQKPTDIVLDKTTLNGGDGAFTVVGYLSTTDPDANDRFTYTLVAGAGSTDNDQFEIMPLLFSGETQLVIKVPANTQSSYSVRIRSTDLGELFVEKAFTITVNTTKVDQSITFNAITASIEVGGPAFALGATATSALPVTYSATPAGRITIDANGNATPVGAGLVEITASQAGNNNYNAATPVKQTVCIAPVAPVVIIQIQSGSEVLTTANGQVLSWFREGTTTVISTGSVFAPTQETAVGTYYAKVDAGEGCLSKPSNKFSVDIVTGLEDLSQVARTWPNPTTDYLFVDNVSAKAFGKMVQLNGTELELPGQYTNNRLQLDVRALAPGIYVLKLVDGKNIRTARIVKN